MNKILTLHQELRSRYQDAAAAIHSALPAPCNAVLISGSGIHSAIPHDSIIGHLPYAHIPGLAHSSVVGHRSEVFTVQFGEVRALVFGGRFHLYEGYALENIIAPILIARHLGITFAILSNAAGGLHPDFRAGDIMLAQDLVNGTGYSVVGEHSTATNLRTLPYCDPEWHRAIADALSQQAVPYRQGTYISLTGPTYETRAEVGYYRKQADAIGMSTIHEAQCALQLGMKVSVCSTITNLLSNTLIKKVTHTEVIETAAIAQSKIRAYIEQACITTQHCCKG